MKRLFTVNGEHFANKVDAKKARDAGGTIRGSVSKGPDHMGNHGRRVPATRHRAPQTDFPKKG